MSAAAREVGGEKPLASVAPPPTKAFFLFHPQLRQSPVKTAHQNGLEQVTFFFATRTFEAGKTRI